MAWTGLRPQLLVVACSCAVTCGRGGFQQGVESAQDDLGAGDSDATSDVDVLGDDDDVSDVPNLAFVTSTTHGANLGGIAGANIICQQRAFAAGLSGAFVAFLWMTGLDPSAQLQGSRGWVDREGRPIADLPQTWRARANQDRGMFTPLVVDELGLRHPESSAWFGEPGATCTEWVLAFGSARVLPLATPFHQSNTSSPCGSAQRLVCLEIGHEAPTSPTPAPGRIIFVTRDNFYNDTGIGGADGLCATEAANAGLIGGFRAFLAVGGMSPEARFTPSSDPLRRVDGALFAVTAADFLDLAGAPYFESFLDITADGTFQHFAPTTGIGSNCNDWSTQSTLLTHGYGDALTVVRSRFRLQSEAPCSSVGKLVCLQD